MSEPDLSSASTVALPFLRALAHDMAAPLTSVLGYAQLNLESPGSISEIQDDLQQMESAAQSLRSHVGILGRLSRYLPAEINCCARQLIHDLRFLTSTAGQSAGGTLKWATEPKMCDFFVQGNPWLLRMTCLAYLGSLCRRASATIEPQISENGLELIFPAPDLEPRLPSPATWGCTPLGEKLLAHQPTKLKIEGEHYHLLLPRWVEEI